MDDAPKLINPSGYISEGHTPQVSLNGVSMSPSATARQIELERAEVQSAVDTVSEETEAELQREVEDGSEESVARQKYATGAYHSTSSSSFILHRRDERPTDSPQDFLPPIHGKHFPNHRGPNH